MLSWISQLRCVSGKESDRYDVLMRGERVELILKRKKERATGILFSAGNSVLVFRSAFLFYALQIYFHKTEFMSYHRSNLNVSN